MSLTRLTPTWRDHVLVMPGHVVVAQVVCQDEDDVGAGVGGGCTPLHQYHSEKDD